MKRFLSFVLSAMMIVASMQFTTLYAVENQLEGSGTNASPWLISDANDFVNMSALINESASYADDYYMMTNDVDFSGVTLTPIGRKNHFKGTFDGQFHAIKNLTMNDTTENTGVFGFVEGGTVCNIQVKNVTVKGAKKVGGLVGRSMNAVFMNITSDANVSGTYDVGGIVGMLNSSQMYNCYSTATTHASNESSGVITGSMNTSLNTNNPVSIDNVYSNGTATGTKYPGNITGWYEGYEAKYPVHVTNTYYVGSGDAFGNSAAKKYDESQHTTLQKVSADASAVELLNANLQNGYAQWALDENGEIIFEKVEFVLKGEGTKESPHLIETVDDLLEMNRAIGASREHASAYYQLKASLDLSGVEFKGLSSPYEFSGTFDGLGHVIKNINIHNKQQTNTGFFHATNGATIQNLGIESGIIEAGARVGGIVGFATNTVIKNCFNNAEISGYYDVGGIVGIIQDTKIYNVFNKGKIRVNNKSIGGIVGSGEGTNAGDSLISNAYNIGQVNVGTYTGKIIGFTTARVHMENVYYDKDAAIKNQPVGNFEVYDEIIGLTKAELMDPSFVDTLNANVTEGMMTWVYGADGIARFAEFEEAAKLDVFVSSIQEAKIENGKVVPIVSEDGAYTATLYGSDHRTVIDLDGNIYQPLTDQKVLLIYDIIDNATGEVVEQLNRNIEVIIEGQYENAGINAVPNVVPGLAEWYGLEGNFVLTNDSKIIADASLAEMATRIQTYMKDMLGIELAIGTGTASAGDIVLVFNEERSAEFQKEGYAMTIDEQIKIEAPTEIGIFYGAVSMMQVLYQDETHTNIPKGYVRDYPQYELRGGMFDVARKYFSIDYVEEMGKYMSWFKMNTLHLHINDNGGEYTASFVVESKDYPALNSYNGTYVWSQEDYKQMQKDLAEFGINVITEIDTPGHAKAFAKVNSTIVSGASFNLASYYNESMALVQSVFNEFVDGEDPVFQGNMIHIGTDESSNSKENMRKYINELSQYMLEKDNIDKVVFWGNLSLYYGENEVIPENVVTQIWDAADYRVDEALDHGFEVINSTSDIMYLVPNQSGEFGPGAFFHGHIDMAKFYDTWKGSSDFDTHNITNPSNKGNGYYYAEHDILKGNPKVLGTIFCDWNDSGLGYDYDILELSMAYIAGVAEKCWYGDENRFESGKDFEAAFNKVGNYAPYANPRYKVDTDTKVIASYDFEEVNENIVVDGANDYDATFENAQITHDEALNSDVMVLNSTSSLSLPFDGVGYPYTASFDLYLDGTQSQDAILFQNDDCTIYLDYQDNGVCFQTTKYTYSFNVDIPTDKWVKVKLTSQSPSFVHAGSNITVLSIDEAEYTPTNITNSRSQSRATVLGSKTMFSGINGKLDNLYIFNHYNYDSVFETYRFAGEGTEASPYLIQSETDLQMFSRFVNAGLNQDAHFKLTTDLDMQDVKYNSVYEFNGVLDGDFHVIRNLTINEASSNVGLIGYLYGGTIKNLGIEDSNITGQKYTGAFAGKTMHATIENCYTNANITGTGDTGGLVGMFNSSHMYNCYSLANVKVNGTSGGGIAGSFNTSLDKAYPVVVDNVYSNATVSATKYSGMLAGWDEGSDMENTPTYITNAYIVAKVWSCGNHQREVNVLTNEQLSDGTLLNALNGNIVDGYDKWMVAENGLPMLESFDDTLKAVSNLVAEVVDYKTIQLNWEAPKGAQSYIVERFTSDGEWVELATTTELTYVASGVKTGKEYTYRVKAVKDEEISEAVEVKATTTLQGEVELTITPNGTTQFDLTWSQIEGATRYIIYRKDGENAWKKVLTLGKDATSYTSKAMKANTYQYQVKAARYDSVDRVMTNGSNVVEGIVGLETMTPTNVKVEANGTTVTLSFDKATGMSYYEIYRSKDGGAYRQIKRTTASTITSSGLKVGSTYQFKIKAFALVNGEKVYAPDVETTSVTIE